MTTQHTPTPWNHSNGTVVFDGNDRKVAATYANKGYGIEIDEAQSNAAFIVRACNAHDELVAALRACVEEMSAYEYADEGISGELIRNARAALAKVQA